MRKNIALTALLLSLVLLFCACGTENADVSNTTGDTTDLTDTNDTIDTADKIDTADTADITDTADTADTADTTDLNDDGDEPELLFNLPTEADWEAITPPHHSWSHTYDAIVALLSGDIDSFAKECSVSPEVYESFRGMVITDYKLSSEEIFYVTNTNPYPILEIEVAESNSEFLPVGTHKLVFDEGLVLRFFKYDEFPEKSSDFQFAASYIFMLGSDRDFYPISAENRRQFGLCDFIVWRLNKLAGDEELRSEAEIREYAEKYLGVDGDTLDFRGIEKYDGGYQMVGRGGGGYEFTVLSEEVIDGINVVTVQFYADYSGIIPSKKVEFYMELLDGEYRPIKTVIIEDSGFETAWW